MATEVIRVVDPDMGSGYDYDSLSDWEADLGNTTSGNLPADNEIAIAKCRCTGGTADTTNCTVDGWTTDSTRYIKIWTDPAEAYRHNGTWQTGNKYRLEANGGAGSGTGVILISENHVTTEGLQIYLTTDTGGDRAGICYIGSCTYSVIEKCIIKANASDTSTRQGVRYHNSGNNHLVRNTLIYDFIQSEGNWTLGISVANGYAHYCYNCTIVNCQRGIYADESLDEAKNCLVSIVDTENEGGFLNFVSGKVNYCASNDSSADNFSGTGNRVLQTFSFVGAADFHLQSTDTGAKGLGLNLYNDAVYPFQDDIDGQDRGGSGADWDIGADQYVSSLLLTQHSFRFRNDDGDEAAATWWDTLNTSIYIAKE